MEIHREDTHIMADSYGVRGMRDQEWNGNTEHLEQLPLLLFPRNLFNFQIGTSVGLFKYQLI